MSRNQHRCICIILSGGFGGNLMIKLKLSAQYCNPVLFQRYFIFRELINSTSDLKPTDPQDQIRLQRTLEKVKFLVGCPRLLLKQHGLLQKILSGFVEGFTYSSMSDILQIIMYRTLISLYMAALTQTQCFLTS